MDRDTASELGEARAGQNPEGSRRQYFRVATRVPLRTRPLSNDEADQLRFDIAQRKAPSEPHIDPLLRAWLERIERKLDSIYAHLDPQQDAPLGPSDSRPIEISGNGLAWEGAPDYAEGDWVAVDLELPRPAAAPIRLLARAIGTHHLEDDRRRNAVAFEAIFEGDRDAIVRHVLDVERRSIQRESGRSSA